MFTASNFHENTDSTLLEHNCKVCIARHYHSTHLYNWRTQSRNEIKWED